MRVEQFAIPLVRAVSQRPALAKLFFARDPWGNPFDTEFYVDPFPVYERMRADGPVTYRRLYQQWFVTGYDESKTALSSSDTAVAGQIDVLLKVTPYTKLSPRAREFFAGWLVLIDPPSHGRLRRLISSVFTPRRIRDLEPTVEALAGELIDALPSESSFDAVESFCAKLPVAVIAQMLGLPPDRWEWSRRTTAEFTKLLDPMQGFEAASVNATIDEVFEYYGALAEQRRSDPQDDLIYALVQAEDEGDRLSHDELVTMIAFLMGAGHETTTNMLAISIRLLALHPQQRSLVRQNPELWPNAVEELLRFDSSIKVAPRVAMRDLHFGEVTIPSGSNVVVELQAANRDPRHFDRPAELLLDRTDPNPISFGHGMHHCLGHALARAELRIGLRRFIERFGDYTIDDAQTSWRRSTVLRGPTNLIVRP